MPPKRLEDFDLDTFSEALSSETDRACAVLGAAILDAKLEQLFRLRLLSDQKELLPSARPLGSFSAKIRLACALGWINDDVRHDLDIVRDIRNSFAHSFDHELSFSDQSVGDRCSNLRIPIALMAGMDVAANTVTNVSPAIIHSMCDVIKPARKRFELSVSFLSQHLDELDHSPATYIGPDLLAQSHDLGARTRLKTIATTTVGTRANPTEG
jgi:DNA-binding MltR family transcriptional regulator